MFIDQQCQKWYNTDASVNCVGIVARSRLHKKCAAAHLRCGEMNLKTIATLKQGMSEINALFILSYLGQL